MMRRRVLWAFAALALSSCSDVQVGGSLGEVYPLGFDSVRIRLYSSSLSVEYVRTDGAVPIRVTADRAAIEAGGTIDLFAAGDVTGRTASGREIPRFNEGELKLDSFRVEDGARVEGSWSASFPVGDTDTLGADGRFSARLDIIEDPGPTPPGRE